MRNESFASFTTSSLRDGPMTIACTMLGEWESILAADMLGEDFQIVLFVTLAIANNNL